MSRQITWGIGDIETIEQMAKVKCGSRRCLNGYAVLNADDPLVAAIAQRVKCQVAYFTMNPETQWCATIQVDWQQCMRMAICRF